MLEGRACASCHIEIYRSKADQKEVEQSKEIGSYGCLFYILVHKETCIDNVCMYAV